MVERGGGRGKRGKARRRGGGGGGASGNAKRAPEKETRFYSTNNRRLWVLKQCEERGMLGPEGTIGVRLQRPDVAKRMVEKGTRSFRIERATDKVKIRTWSRPRRCTASSPHPGTTTTKTTTAGSAARTETSAGDEGGGGNHRGDGGVPSRPPPVPLTREMM